MITAFAIIGAWAVLSVVFVIMWAIFLKGANLDRIPLNKMTPEQIAQVMDRVG